MASPAEQDPGDATNTAKHLPRHRHAPFGPLQPQEQGVEDLVDAAARSFLWMPWTPDKKPLCDVIEWLEDWNTRWQETEYMIEGIHILCRTFFLRELPSVEFSWDAEDCRQKDVLGQCAFQRSRDHILIVMDPTDRHEERGIADHKSFLLGNLFHELCHAFIAIWGCKGYCEDFHCRTRIGQLFGKSGHGIAWFLLAVYVEVTARKHLHWLDVRLSVLQSVCHECEHRDGVPTEIVWARLNRDLEHGELSDFVFGAPEAFMNLASEYEELQDSLGNNADLVAWWRRWVRGWSI